MKTRKHWSHGDLQQLADLSAQGLSASQIAKKIGASPDAVKSVMRRRGLFARPKCQRVSVVSFV